MRLALRATCSGNRSRKSCKIEICEHYRRGENRPSNASPDFSQSSNFLSSNIFSFRPFRSKQDGRQKRSIHRFLQC